MTRQPSVFDGLAHRRRRRVIGVLALTPHPVPVDDLATSLSNVEHETPTTTQTKRIRTSLHHRHLQRLTTANVVKVTDDVVSPGAEFQPVFQTLATGLTTSTSHQGQF